MSTTDPTAAPDLTDAAASLRNFMLSLRSYLNGVAGELEKTQRSSEAATVKQYTERIDELLAIPYEKFIPPGEDAEEIPYEGEKMIPPDLRTFEGALRFLSYHRPNAAARAAHQNIDTNFQALLSAVWDVIPEGPGRTVFLRSLNLARMDANCAIANLGA